MKIYIDSSSRVLYASFYISGLYDYFGKANVKFSKKYFKDLNRKNENFAFEHYFAFVLVESNGSIRKCVVDFCDPPDISKTAYEWCDIYGKINLNNTESDPAIYTKIVPIPPSFGVRIWSLPESIYYAAVNYCRNGFRTIVPPKRYFQDYYLQYKRPRLLDYTSKSEDKKSKFIFLIGTLWKDEEGVNLRRKQFLDAVKQKGFELEGGFYAISNQNLDDSFKPWLFQRRYSASEYLTKTKRSSFVFNTPAVHGCHGWKLAEYIAMGKAIISTPLINVVPVPLGHGVHLHVVHSADELIEAVDKLSNDSLYSKKLESNCINYYFSTLQPSSVIEAIVQCSQSSVKKSGYFRNRF